MSFTMRCANLIGVAAIASVAFGATGAAQSDAARNAAALTDFSTRVAAYADLIKKAAEGLPPLKRTDDPVEIASREAALANAARAARAAARPGDIMTPEVARVLRRIIKQEFRRRSRAGQRVMRDEVEETHGLRVKVNQTYPTEWPLLTFPPQLLAILPRLPAGLEYRLLNDALFLRDATANIVVDFILDVY